MTHAATVSDVVIQVRDDEAVNWRGHQFAAGAILTVPVGYARSLERQGRAYIIGPR